jgi:hypothetical protein
MNSHSIKKKPQNQALKCKNPFTRLRKRALIPRQKIGVYMSTVGSFLSDLQRRVDNYIELVSFRKPDDMTPFELSAARAIGLALENTKNHLSESGCLEKTQDKVDRVAQSSLNELESFVQALEQKTPSLFKMETLATDYIASLFHPSLPKLETIEPKQIDLSRKFEVITVHGNFRCASHRYPPNLTFNGVVLEPSQIEPNYLSFSIVPNRINPANTAFISGVLTVPRNVGWCCGKMFKSHFNVWIGNFPEPPKVDAELFSYKEPEAHTAVPYVRPYGDSL